MSRSALITGVTGFIGGVLARRLLAQGWTVDVIVRPGSDPLAIPEGVRVHRGDTTVAELRAVLVSCTPDVVFHLASLYLAEHRPEQVDALIESNVLFPARLAQAMSDTGVRRLINAGTASQHFGTPDYRPVSLYAATKQACVDLLRYYHEDRSLSVITLKIFDTYSAGDTRRKLVQLLVDAAVSGETLDMSPGEQILDLSHVDDIAAAFIVAAERLLGGDEAVFEDYLLTGERHDVRALVRIIADAIGLPIAANFGARAYRAREVMLPVVAAPEQRLPGWVAERRLGEALASMIRPAA